MNKNPTFLFQKSGRKTMLSQESIQEFKQIYFRKFGEELSDEEATEKANRIYELHKALFDYLSEQAKKVMNHNEQASINQ